MFSSGWLPLNPISIGFNDGAGYSRIQEFYLNTNVTDLVT